MTAPASSMGNRRTCRRAELDAPVLLDAESSYYTARCRDVSQAGLGVETQAELKIGTWLDVYFELPTGVAVEARAQVTRVASNRIGIAFREIRQDCAAALREYCEGWRTQLLQSCAARAASARNVRIVSQPPPSAVRAPSQRAPFDPTEYKSEVRVRVAPIIPVTGERKA
ncbi:MAG: PilZ domain-containing protein [Myxococcota bacterium]